MTLEELKALIETDDDDEVLEFKLQAGISYAQWYCRDEFIDDDGELDVPPAVKMGIAILVEGFNQTPNVSSESVAGELSVSYFSPDATMTANAYFKPFRRAVFL